MFVINSGVNMALIAKELYSTPAREEHLRLEESGSIHFDFNLDNGQGFNKNASST